MKRSIENNSISWLWYILPALLVYSLFLAIPLFASLRMSLYTGKGFLPDQFIGLGNYVRLFSDKLVSERFWNAFRNTWVFFAVHMIVQNSLGLLFAVMLNSSLIKARPLFRTIIFIPATLAIVVTGFLWKILLNPTWELADPLLKALSFGLWQGPWTEHALVTIALVSSWQWVGIPTMIFLAALQGINNEYYEAAAIDGATRLKVFWHIVLPLLKPIIIVVAILTFTANFNAFDVVFAMAGPNGPPQYSSDILGTYFYRTGIAGEHPVGVPDAGLGAAVASVVFIVLLLGVMIIRRLGAERDAK